MDNRITALSEPTPLAAAERPSVASRERGSGRAPDAVFSPYASVRHFTPHMVLFLIICTDAAWLSQYTLRYRYVTGSWLRPDTRKVNGLTRPDGLVCSRHPLTDEQ